MDEVILSWIHAVFGSPVLDAAAPVITYLGEAGAVWIVVGVVLVCTRTYRFWGMVMLFALLVVFVFDECLLKSLIARERPFIADPTISLLIAAPAGYSFPSGHAGTSFAAATVIAFMPIRTRWKAVVFVLATAIALSRTYLFVHYPSDIVAGALLGCLYGIVVVKVALYMRSHRRQAPAHPTAVNTGDDSC